MGKFTSTVATAGPSSPSRSTPTRLPTHEGAPAYARDGKSELYALAATNFAGEDTFYESARDRDSRFVALTRDIAVTDPGWVARLVPYLRGTLNMRSASISLAVEAAIAWRNAGTALPDGVSVRSVIASACQRADEPAEVIAYWRLATGRRTLPSGVQRGVADAVTALYTERAALKWDGQRNDWRLGDVIEVVHPTPQALWQANLFRFLLDRRRHAGEVEGTQQLEYGLPLIAANTNLRSMLPADQRAFLLQNPERLAAHGVTWEYLAGLGPMDDLAWAAILPTLGYMALLRNLRNIDQARVPDAVVAPAIARIADPDQVASSRQLPFRFLSAYRAAPSLRWGHALSQALDLSLANVPSLPGRWLVLLDTSGSMTATLSDRSTVSRTDAAAVLAAAMSTACDGVDVGIFGQSAARGDRPTGCSALQVADSLAQMNGSVGHSTNMRFAVCALYAGHDGVVIVTDDQSTDGDPGEAMPAQVPLVRINVGGYRPLSGPAGGGVHAPNRHEVVGLTDAVFTTLRVIAEGRDADWPF